MDEADLAVVLYRAVHAPLRPGVELAVEPDEAAEAALRAHVDAETRRLTRGLSAGVEFPAGAADALVRRPDWLFGDFRWELGEPTEALGRAALSVTLRPDTPMPVFREQFVERIEVLVDVETGLLLRLVEVFDARVVRTVTVQAIGPAAPVADPEPEQGATVAFGLPSRAADVGASARAMVLTLGRMALDPATRRAERGGGAAAGAPIPFEPTEPLTLPEPAPSVEEVVRLLARARLTGLAGRVCGDFFEGRFALPDERRFRLDLTRASGPLDASAQAYDGERYYRLMEDRLVVERATPSLFFLGTLRRPRAALRRPLAVRDVVDWEGRRAVRLTIGSEVAVVDAETGVVLANPYLELHDLGPAPKEPEFYRIEAPEGVPVVESDGGVLGDALLAPPVRAGLEGAARAIGGLAEGVARLLGG